MQHVGRAEMVNGLSQGLQRMVSPLVLMQIRCNELGGGGQIMKLSFVASKEKPDR